MKLARQVTLGAHQLSLAHPAALVPWSCCWEPRSSPSWNGAPGPRLPWHMEPASTPPERSEF